MKACQDEEKSRAVSDDSWAPSLGSIAAREHLCYLGNH